MRGPSAGPVRWLLLSDLHFKHHDLDRVRQRAHQFGRCIRSGLAANDIVNDIVGKDCPVMLEFANGYATSRHRKHKSHGNRVVISLRGEPQLLLEPRLGCWHTYAKS